MPEGKLLEMGLNSVTPKTYLLPCRLLAPGYTETHYSPDGQPVVLFPNHMVRFFHGL